MEFEEKGSMISGGIIVLIDDDDDLRCTTKELLEMHGCIVEEAHCGEMGIHKVKESNPDIVILDLVMPGLNGWEVLKILREDLGYMKHVILYSGSIDLGTDFAKMEIPNTSFVFKPLLPRRLLSLIEERIADGNTEAEKYPVAGKHLAL